MADLFKSIAEKFQQVFGEDELPLPSKIVFTHGGRQARHGSVGFTEPCMRDTEYDFSAGSEQEEDKRYGPIWNDLNSLPWASDFSPYAKVALNGVIIKGAEL